MDEMMIAASRALAEARSLETLHRANETGAYFGLCLSGPQMEQLALRHTEALRGTGRVEFGEGIWGKLVHTFCDSPNIAPKDWADTLGALMECFYYAKGEAMERFSDDELLCFMKRHFDGDCHGSVELLSGTLLEVLADGARHGEAAGALLYETRLPGGPPENPFASMPGDDGEVPNDE